MKKNIFVNFLKISVFSFFAFFVFGSAIASASGNLTVVTEVVNHGVGTSTPADFVLSVSGTNVSTSTFSGDSNGVVVALDDGPYSVAITSPSGYTVTENGNCSGIMGPSGLVPTCIFTASDIYPEDNGLVTVVPNIINNNGGTLKNSDVTLFIKSLDNPADPAIALLGGVPKILPSGNYIISNSNLPGYNVSYVCQNNIGSIITYDGTINLSAQESWTCSLTADDIAPSLALIKKVINDNGGTATSTDWLLTATGSTTISGYGSVVSFDSSLAGTYTLSETPKDASLNNKYTSGSWVCSGTLNNGNKITLGIGQSAVCTVTNDDKPATLAIIKKSVGGTGTFNFSVSSSTNQNIPILVFSVSTVLNNPATSSVVNVNKGTFDVIETLLSGWTLSSSTCSINGQVVGTNVTNGKQVKIDNGDSVVCTFTNTVVNNTPKGTLVVVKQIVNPGPGSLKASDFKFKIWSGDWIPFNANSSWPYYGENKIQVDPGMYSVTEQVQPNYTVIMNTCGFVSVPVNETKSCLIASFWNQTN